MLQASYMRSAGSVTPSAIIRPLLSSMLLSIARTSTAAPPAPPLRLEKRSTKTQMRRLEGLHPCTGGLPATRVALPQRGNVRAEMTHKKGVAEQRNFLCEEGCCCCCYCGCSCRPETQIRPTCTSLHLGHPRCRREKMLPPARHRRVRKKCANNGGAMALIV